MSRTFLKTNGAAKYLGVSRSSLTNWVKQGLLGSGTTPGGHYRFTLEELDKFAAERGLEVAGSVDVDEQPTRILLIDDDRDFRDFVGEALQTFSGYELRDAADGVQGALLVGTWAPDLIILDMRMPNMNGLDFLKLIRSDSKTASLKVMVASAYLSDELRVEIESVGVDLLLEKPVRLGKLIAGIEKLTHLRINEE
jgi:excisionase family DNA binding protein